MDADGTGDECDCLPDLTNNDVVTFEDLALFASHWHATGCMDPPDPDYCGATDFDKSGAVDAADLKVLAEKWLADANL